MSTSLELRVLAKKIEQDAHNIMSKVDLASQRKYAKSFANSINELESLAESMEGSVTEEHLNVLAKVAEALDSTGNPALRKQATLLDELLLTIAAPKNAMAERLKVTEDELNKLRAEYRIKEVERLYMGPKKALDKQNNVNAVRKAIETQVKTFVPMEAPLSTRYPPDRPGGHLTRIADGVYQDVLTGKTYDYRNGYTTDKGNKVPGGAVEYQIPELNDVNSGHTIFDTREMLMSRYAGEGLGNVLKSFGQSGDSFMTREVPSNPGEREANERTMYESESPELGEEISRDFTLEENERDLGIESDKDYSETLNNPLRDFKTELLNKNKGEAWVPKALEALNNFLKENKIDEEVRVPADVYEGDERVASSLSGVLRRFGQEEEGKYSKLEDDVADSIRDYLLHGLWKDSSGVEVAEEILEMIESDNNQEALNIQKDLRDATSYESLDNLESAKSISNVLKSFGKRRVRY